MKRTWLIAFAIVLVFSTFTDAKEVVKFADLPWNPSLINNRIATFILKHGYGYDVEFTSGMTIPMWQGLQSGDLHVQMATYSIMQMEAYTKAIEAGLVVSIGENYSPIQGWWVPRYVIKGDAKRGLKALAPDLVTVFDLPKYWSLFKDPEDPTKGRLYSSVLGSTVETTMSIKFKQNYYKPIADTYKLFPTGTDTAQVTALVTAYEKGDPILIYYWIPSWPLAKYDMTKVAEPIPFDRDTWAKNRCCDWPRERVEVCVNAAWKKKMDKEAPEVIAFLSKFSVGLEEAGKFLLHNVETKETDEQTAIWFLKQREEKWSQWVPQDVVRKVKAALPK